VPVDQVPRGADHEAQLRWLYDWWQVIDEWISQSRQDDEPATETKAEPVTAEAGESPVAGA